MVSKDESVQDILQKVVPGLFVLQSSFLNAAMPLDLESRQRPCHAATPD